MKENKYEWSFNGYTYQVGNSLEEPSELNSIYPIVWYKNKLYTATIKPETSPRKNRVCLVDIYRPNKKPYWTTVDKVFQIIKIK